MAADIKVEVRLFATLRELFPLETIGVKDVCLPADSTIDCLLDAVGIKDKINLILMVNGRREKDFNKVLAEGDRVALFPPVGGG